mgnify:FL=1
MIARASKARHEGLKAESGDVPANYANKVPIHPTGEPPVEPDLEPGWNDGEPIDPVWLREFNRLIGRAHPH